MGSYVCFVMRYNSPATRNRRNSAYQCYYFYCRCTSSSVGNNKKQKILMNNSEVILQLSNLDIGYQISGKKRVVLNSLNTALYKGELVCLLAPNGAGKSTLIKTITGILPPLNGEVAVLGKNITTIPVKELAA